MIAIRTRLALAAFFLLSGGFARAEEGQTVCTDKNNYLEKYFSAPRPSATGCVRREDVQMSADLANLCQGISESDFSKECVREVMKGRLLPGSTFKDVEGPDGKKAPRLVREIFYLDCAKSPPAKSPAPCVSEGYVDYVWKNYGEAMKCLDLDPREMIGLIAAESRFQLNIGNNAGAFGPGQLLRSSGNGVEIQDLTKLYRDKPECASAEALLQKKAKPAFPSGCDLVGPPDNPLKNFIYSGIFYKSAHDEAGGLAGRGGARGPDFVKIRHDLALYFYNAGGSTIRPAVENYLRAVPGGMASYAAFSQRFPAYLRAHFGESIAAYEADAHVLEVKRVEVSAYANAVNAIPRQISQATGKACHI